MRHTNGAERHDVCIVGAGIAGLNALAVASEYLSADQTVALVDRRPRPGGMWLATYPYVQLHQPHPMFTAGNIPWTLGKDRSHLASRDEVLDHMQHCFDVADGQAGITRLFGWEVESHEEANGSVRVTCRSADGTTRLIEANRLIRALGFDIAPNDRLEVSSTRVTSVSPDHCDMRGPEMRASDAPVWVIGGGKTAMDTVHALITEYPGREVNLVAGSGTFFFNRDVLFPDGARRWWGGTRANHMFRETARHFDGTNGEAVNDWFREKYGLSTTPETRNFMLGILSELESRTIVAGLRHVVMGHLEDVVDRGERTDLALRSGDTIAIEPGSWIVNCTGYILQRPRAHEPVVSQHGRVLSIQQRAATMPLTTHSGYFLTHLLFRDELTDAPLYELDLSALRSRARSDFVGAVASLVQHNLSVFAERLPSRVLLGCGPDNDRWYPLPRRLFGMARFLATHRRDREHCRRSLDALRERHEILGGVRGGWVAGGHARRDAVPSARRMRPAGGHQAV